MGLREIHENWLVSISSSLICRSSYLFTADNTDCDFHEEYTNIKYYFGDRVGDGADNGIFQVSG